MMPAPKPAFLRHLMGSMVLAAAVAGAPLLSAAADAPPAADAAGAADGAGAGAAASGAGSAGLFTVDSLSNIPAPSVDAKAWLVMDANSGQVIAAHNPQDAVEPASLTKIMAAYVVFDALENGRLKLDQKVHVSEKAWKTEGSRMFIDPNSDVPVDDLLQGLIVQSGNDATVALAEAVGGSESAFVALMNQQAQELGLKHTHFVNAPGLPDPDHTTTVQDLALMTRALVQRFPQYMHYYSQKEYTYNKIRQGNRNRLLWVDDTIDGLKTGHTKSAGYCLVTTALRDGRRVISVVVGAGSEASRAESSLKLLNWGYKNFDTVRLLEAGQSAVTAEVWEGEADSVGLGLDHDLWVTVPRGQADSVHTEARYPQPLLAPLSADAVIGTLQVELAGHTLAQQPLQVLAAVPEAGIVGRLFDKIRLLFH
ncbi:D-alanyl-D-alanine carboxypeptidase family protein [Castellaniella sp.]|uniref:D-alanyl-D-alanine carboxypeptidase family protein n=1 Tax=Castellaniella sp. TaxID=1955812 RepID=UPI00355E09AC